MMDDSVLRWAIEDFEEGFPDGVYVVPSDAKDTKIRVKDLFEYCKKNWVRPKDLADKEREQFIIYEEDERQ